MSCVEQINVFKWYFGRDKLLWYLLVSWLASGYVLYAYYVLFTIHLLVFELNFAE